MSMGERIFVAAYYVAVMAIGMGIFSWSQGRGFLLEGKDHFALVFFAIGLLQGMRVASGWKE